RSFHMLAPALALRAVRFVLFAAAVLAHLPEHHLLEGLRAGDGGGCRCFLRREVRLRGCLRCACRFQLGGVAFDRLRRRRGLDPRLARWTLRTLPAVSTVSTVCTFTALATALATAATAPTAATAMAIGLA